MDKLEMLSSLKKRFGLELNPTIQSIMYCQSKDFAFLEIENTQGIIKIDLGFIGGEIVEENGIAKEILPLFDPCADIVDNASTLLALDEYSLIMCLDNILTEAAVERILEEFKNNHKGAGG